MREPFGEAPSRFVAIRESQVVISEGEHNASIRTVTSVSPSKVHEAVHRTHM